MPSILGIVYALNLGGIFEYFNMGFSFLGNLLARCTGTDGIEQFLLDLIARPLVMNTTHIQLTLEMKSRMAAPLGDILFLPCSYVESALYPSGGIRFTANDMQTEGASHESTNPQGLFGNRPDGWL